MDGSKNAGISNGIAGFPFVTYLLGLLIVSFTCTITLVKTPLEKKLQPSRPLQDLSFFLSIYSCWFNKKVINVCILNIWPILPSFTSTSTCTCSICSASSAQCFNFAVQIFNISQQRQLLFIFFLSIQISKCSSLYIVFAYSPSYNQYYNNVQTCTSQNATFTQCHTHNE